MPSRNRRLLAELQEKVLIYLRLQRFQAAEELLKTALGEHGHLANLLNLLGLIYHRQSQFAQAIEYFEKARLANPSFVEASLNLAVTYADLGFYDQAEKIYSEAHDLLSERQSLPDLVMGRVANLHSRTAQGYEQAGLWQEAASEYSKALQVFPRMPDIRLRLAKLYLRMGAFHQSQEQLGLLIEEGHGSTHPECLNLMGSISFRLGDPDSALAYWEKAQLEHPNDRTSRTYIKTLNPSSH